MKETGTGRKWVRFFSRNFWGSEIIFLLLYLDDIFTVVTMISKWNGDISCRIALLCGSARYRGHQTEGRCRQMTTATTSNGQSLDLTWESVELSLFTMVWSSLFSQFTSLTSMSVVALECLSKEKWLCWLNHLKFRKGYVFSWSLKPKRISLKKKCPQIQLKESD